ncbi:DUF11 domain-containing protein [Variovorax sp. PCZ-1]|uniref:beta strand repeat-containing protein n=1 Tax=Variovorax sp. PCZ-1 TaxID=2835533 RepID=UPI001BCD5E38|nr:DUF11 domain-containing protein [Variovorax sp. PCZ-1]MBS7807560.1 hypothetical protein [Variovorax sp. PCZ-1]
MINDYLDEAYRFIRQFKFGIILLFTALGPGWLLAQTCSIPAQGAAATINAAPNTYFPGLTANLTAGSTQIALGAGRGVNAAINPGDLLLIIQMQGAVINTSNTNQYGDGAGSGVLQDNTGDPARGSVSNTAGTYEFAVATNAVAFAGGATVNLSAPLQNAYTDAAAAATPAAGNASGQQRYQVIRIPQFTSLTLNGTLSPPQWNGTTGGVLVLDVAGQLNFNGQTINAALRGFRGGGGVNQAAVCTASGGSLPCTEYRAVNANPANGAFKGEGIAGTPALVFDSITLATVGSAAGANGYPNGDRGRGAPGNAGGGGNQHNSGGGGGGNGGLGGFGGNTWNASNATFTGTRHGGFGGANNYNLATRVVMGGGGGAGDFNDTPTGPLNAHGGSGGGIVMIRAGSLIGAGTINANGANGISSNATDAAGGGGAGGTVWITTGTGVLPNTLNITATGGTGANSGPMAGSNETDGPGGGGGGGVFLTNSTGAVFTAAGGIAGVMNNSQSDVCGNFAPSTNPQCFATAGGVGATTTIAIPVANTGVRPAPECLPDVRVSKATSTPSISASGAATAAYTINLQNFGGGARNVNVFDNALPPGWTLASAPTYTFFPAGPIANNNLPSGSEASTTAGGATFPLGTAPTTAPAIGNTTLTWQQFFLAPLKAGVPSQITISMIVNIPASAPVGCYHNGAGYSMLDPTFLAAAANRTVTSATNNGANRIGALYNTNSTYASGAITNVAGNNYSGLPNGPAAEDVCLLADLSLTKTVTPTGTLAAGQTAIYTITPRNNGRGIRDTSFTADQSTTATNAVSASAVLASGNLLITDTLPAGVTFTTQPSSTGWTCTPTGTVVTCSRNAPIVPIAATTDLPAITGTVRVTAAACPGPITNRAEISSVQAPYTESTLVNNSASVTNTLNCSAQLAVTKTNAVTTPLSLSAGQTTDYTVTFSNAGPSSADGSIARDVPSAGLSNCSVVPTSCIATGGSPAATCPASANFPNLLTPGGLILPSFPSGSSISFVVRCGVTASGL